MFINLLRNIINSFVLENYCYMLFVGQINLLRTLVQSFNKFIYQTFVLTAKPIRENLDHACDT